MRPICHECGSILTDTERRYYGDRCEGCECAWFERIETWRHGGKDAELDDLFSATPRQSH
jgi:hypothetical protein